MLIVVCCDVFAVCDCDLWFAACCLLFKSFVGCWLLVVVGLFLVVCRLLLGVVCCWFPCPCPVFAVVVPLLLLLSSYVSYYSLSSLNRDKQTHFRTTNGCNTGILGC